MYFGYKNSETQEKQIIQSIAYKYRVESCKWVSFNPARGGKPVSYDADDRGHVDPVTVVSLTQTIISAASVTQTIITVVSVTQTMIVDMPTKTKTHGE